MDALSGPQWESAEVSPPERKTGKKPNKSSGNGFDARDNNVLEVVRKGRTLSFGQWADFFLENYSKPPMRAEKTHQTNLACRKAPQGCVGYKQTGGHQCGPRRVVSS